MCYRYSLEALHQSATNEYPQHIFPQKNKKCFPDSISGGMGFQSFNLASVLIKNCNSTGHFVGGVKCWQDVFNASVAELLKPFNLIINRALFEFWPSVASSKDGVSETYLRLKMLNQLLCIRNIY